MSKEECVPFVVKHKLITLFILALLLGITTGFWIHIMFFPKEPILSQSVFADCTISIRHYGCDTGESLIETCWTYLPPFNTFAGSCTVFDQNTGISYTEQAWEEPLVSYKKEMPSDFKGMKSETLIEDFQMKKKGLKDE